MQELILSNVAVKASTLSKLKCLQTISVLKLNKFKDTAALFPVLAGNSELESIYIFDPEPVPSASSFAALKNCRKLRLLELSRCPVNDQVLEAITDKLQLFSLRLSAGGGIEARKILSLARKHKDMFFYVRMDGLDVATSEAFKAAAACAKNIKLE